MIFALLCVGEILDFDLAISQKIDEIIGDSVPCAKQGELFPVKRHQGKIQLYCGSCLQIMPKLLSRKYNAILTSPPYCNRYDYTRTYALELALLGINEDKLIQFRQEMLSCNVRYAGASISADMILSSLAEKLGFAAECWRCASPKKNYSCNPFNSKNSWYRVLVVMQFVSFKS